ncbi:MAG: hypothetical protein CME68_00655 [Halobacteriovoraceae bacterium]|nr:hypothetical protein [Halobacteriovoraceae bacterium]|tara:strand:+ start:309 stop:920 length:612 start_codon:yes stop_codon:yes gene_type:complete
MPRLRGFCHFLQCIFRTSFTFHLLIASFGLPFFLSEASGGLKKVEKAKTITLIEYFDFSCPLSAQSSKSLNSFKDQIGSHVSVIRRSLAFSEGGLSWIAGKYYHALLKQNKKLAETFHKRVFEQTLNGEINETFLKDVITDLGINFIKFESGLKSSLLEKQLRQNEVLANKSGVFVSPGYTFDGQVLLGKQERSDFGKLLNHR